MWRPPPDVRRQARRVVRLRSVVATLIVVTRSKRAPARSSA
jgi:hypothetical protein